ncbi:Crp/Fnr family transcriptional regulator [Yoonia maritima]|uniref:Crp/Fnr family transcriptional regulator n=1 Tax=Yoonia maritima TaxID=1435347 RepID=UPI000D105C79|nr:Crp/Fnr family transcriptional regulator [Yoonia maritima]
MNDIQRARAKLSGTLANCSLFSGISDDELSVIAQKMDVIAAPRGRLVMQHGDFTSETYFLISGGVIGQLVADNGREILFTEIAVGGYFGELAALDGAARSITISASADCVFAKLSGAKFREILLAHPQTAVNLATDLGAQLRGMNERVFDLVVHSVETRVSIRLMQLAQAQEQLIQGGVINDAPTREGMANFVGSNREAVSRAIARLNKAGIIETMHKKVVILDLDRLLESAEGTAQ